MSKNTKSSGSASHPYLWRWSAEFGTIEIGHRRQTSSFIRALDEGASFGRRRSYRTLDAALADAEAGVARWMKDQFGITEAV